MSQSLRDILNENCGLAAAINVPTAAEIVRHMLMVQQHRGPTGAGIVSSNNHDINIYNGFGRVDRVFLEDFDFQNKLSGDIASGHNRYATKGSIEKRANLQPLLFRETKYGPLTFAHNGQLLDINNLRGELIQNGSSFQSTTDSETLAHLITQSNANTIEEAIENEITKIPTAYSLIIMTESKVIALRDKYGVRPLSIAKLGEGYLVASETTAFRIFPDAEFIRDIKPGEMVVFDRTEIQSGGEPTSIQFAEPEENLCVFELIYFSEPRSKYNGFMHEDFRELCGMAVYDENKEFFDSLKSQFGKDIYTVPILDSGKHGAWGFEKASGILYREYFMRRHNAPNANGRSYMAANPKSRDEIAFMKLDLRKEVIYGKAIITVDDSIVRGTTSRRYNQRLRDAGAKLIVNVIVSPTLTDICYLGMDHQSRDQLLAFNHQTPEEISKETGADKTVYLSLNRLNKIVDNTYKCGTCSGCFGGNYPVDLKSK